MVLRLQIEQARTFFEWAIANICFLQLLADITLSQRIQHNNTHNLHPIRSNSALKTANSLPPSHPVRPREPTRHANFVTEEAVILEKEF